MNVKDGFAMKFAIDNGYKIGIISGGTNESRNAKYTKSNHYVTGFEYALGNASRISIEGFIKQYGNFPISIVDGVSLANKGARIRKKS